MKKNILIALSLTLIISLAGCTSNGTTSTDSDYNPDFDNDTASETFENDSHPTEEERKKEYESYVYFEDNMIDKATLHPFAIAILEYFADGVIAPYNDPNHTRAFLVDVDGNGTKGVLAMRHEAHGDRSFPFGRIFYIYDDELFYKDVGPQDAGFITGITVESNRAVNILSDGGQWSSTLFSIESGRLIESFTIYEQPMCCCSHPYYYFPSGTYNWVNRQSLTQEEFNTLLVRYGLDNIRNWWDDDDETAKILAMPPM